MAISFLSTLPSLLPHNPQIQSPTLPKQTNGSILCQKNDISALIGEQCSRREALGCFGTVVGTEILLSSGTFTRSADAADLNQRRQRSEFLSKIKETLSTSIKTHADLLPSILTLALNDAITYDKATKTGGPNGSIRFSSEISRPENSGLSAALEIIEEAKKEINSYSKGGPISYSDLIQLAVQSAVKSTFLAAAIKKCGGNEEKGRTLYTAYGSAGQSREYVSTFRRRKMWGLFDRQFGRTDTEEPDPEGRIPKWDKASVQEMKDRFVAVAIMSAFLGPDQLATETLLASDPQVRPWVDKYQRSRETVSQTDYEVDLITTLTKLSCLGQKINYEAYTYALPKIDIRKLKL